MKKKKAETLIVGARSAGRSIVNELLHSEYVSNTPIAFVDDDPAKIGTEYQGVKAVGTTQDIPRVVNELSISENFICMPSIDKGIVNRLYGLCSQTKRKVKILPGLQQIINMGAMRRICEMMVQTHSTLGLHTPFSITRCRLPSFS